MVDAHSAGVCLVRPAEAPDSIRLEAVAGLGQILVSGDAEPDVFVLGWDDLAVRTRRRGEQFIEMKADGALGAISLARRGRWKVSDAQVHEVATLARALDRHFRFDVGTDMEWAFDRAGQLFTLQLRPLAA
jgi:pyruvate,water dikinase